MHEQDDEAQHADEAEAPKSKSQLKREMHALQALGEELAALSAEHFTQIQMPETLRDALTEARRMHSHGARKRQLQYVGRVMRGIDAEPIREQLETLRGQSRRAHAQLHHIEQWRERLLDEGDTALGALLGEHPQADRQHLRQLMRSARQERLANKHPPRATRALFHYLRELLDENEDGGEVTPD